MNDITENPIFPDSDESAKFVTGISGWVDRHGNFFGKSESMARHNGSTHRRCDECHESIVLRGYKYCEDCKEKKYIERYSKLEKKVWDSECFLYSDRDDVYFQDYDYLNDYLYEHEIVDINSLRLIICDPVYLRNVTEDFWSGDLPDDTELPESVLSALEIFNAELKDAGIISWTPGKFAAIVNFGAK